jgi:cytochrome c-type biogenesis protein CcmE
VKPQRRQRLAAVLFILAGSSITLTLMIFALGENANLFYEPAKVVSGEAPQGVTMRAGGVVLEGSVQRDDTGFGITFALTDRAGHDFHVAYNGLLPDMFREGEHILVTGEIGPDGVFQASEVLAKHDENMVPRETKHMAEHPAAAAFEGAAAGT